MNKIINIISEIFLPLSALLILIAFFNLLIYQENNREIQQYEYSQLQTLSNIKEFKSIISPHISDSIITIKEYNSIMKAIDSNKINQSKYLLLKD